jgi:hypothetical protein
VVVLTLVPIGSPGDGTGSFGVVTIATERKQADYFLEPISSDFGVAYTLREVGHVEQYHVCLHGRQSSCECLGFLHTGHCKHVDGLNALAAAGKIPGSPAVSAPQAEPIPA